MLKILLLIAAIAVTFQSCAPKKFAPINKAGIVRMHTADAKDRAFCSAVIISSTQALTAAHCVMDCVFGCELTEPVVVLKDVALGAQARARVVGANPSTDVAMLEGEFSDFHQHEIIESVEALHLMWEIGSPAVACGYPYGGEMFCTELSPTGFYIFKFFAEGQLIPGMSGGPVIDKATGKVIAVNSAMLHEIGSNRAILAPLWNLYAMLGLPRP